MTRTSTGRVRGTRRILTLHFAAALTLAVLLKTRPRVPATLSTFTSDDLAISAAWLGAVVASAWLTVTAIACKVALARGKTRTADRLARWAPPLVRRVLQAALVSTWALVPAAAYASPPSGPVTVHVGADGRLVTVPKRPEPREAPVVRTPPSSAVRAPTSTSVSTATTTPAPPSRPIPQAASRPAPVTTTPTPTADAPSASRIHLVQPGDNLWRIARAELIRAAPATRPDDAQIATYWQRMIAANRSTLRSGDPSLIFPGEIVTLPAHTAAPTL